MSITNKDGCRIAYALEDIAGYLKRIAAAMYPAQPSQTEWVRVDFDNQGVPRVPDLSKVPEPIPLPANLWQRGEELRWVPKEETPPTDEDPTL